LEFIVLELADDNPQWIAGSLKCNKKGWAQVLVYGPQGAQ
jgi:hypothetical protein